MLISILRDLKKMQGSSAPLVTDSERQSMQKIINYICLNCITTGRIYDLFKVDHAGNKILFDYMIRYGLLSEMELLVPLVISAFQDILSSNDNQAMYRGVMTALTTLVGSLVQANKSSYLPLLGSIMSVFYKILGNKDLISEPYYPMIIKESIVSVMRGHADDLDSLLQRSLNRESDGQLELRRATVVHEKMMYHIISAIDELLKNSTIQFIQDELYLRYLILLAQVI